MERMRRRQDRLQETPGVRHMVANHPLSAIRQAAVRGRKRNADSSERSRTRSLEQRRKGRPSDSTSSRWQNSADSSSFNCNSSASNNCSSSVNSVVKEATATASKVPDTDLHLPRAATTPRSTHLSRLNAEVALVEVEWEWVCRSWVC